MNNSVKLGKSADFGRIPMRKSSDRRPVSAGQRESPGPPLAVGSADQSTWRWFWNSKVLKNCRANQSIRPFGPNRSRSNESDFRVFFFPSLAQTFWTYGTFEDVRLKLTLTNRPEIGSHSSILQVQTDLVSMSPNSGFVSCKNKMGSSRMALGWKWDCFFISSIWIPKRASFFSTRGSLSSSRNDFCLKREF